MQETVHATCAQRSSGLLGPELLGLELLGLGLLGVGSRVPEEGPP